MPSIEWLFVYLVLGAMVGFLAGLLGVGGGGILVPTLAALFLHQGLDSTHVVHLALGTSLAAMVVSTAAGSRAHARRGVVCMPVVLTMTPGIMMGVLFSTQLAARLNSRTVALVFSGVMALAAIQMSLNWEPKAGSRPMTSKELFPAGAVIGAISALAAVGGGFLSIAYLSYRNLEMKKAVGTSTAIGLPIAATATIGYLASGWSSTSDVPGAFGYIYLPALLVLATASWFAAPLGVRLAHQISAQKLKKLFALLSLVLSLRMFLSL